MQDLPSPLSLVVGLGNPGEGYRGTRHNVGFDCVERVRSSLTEVRELPIDGGELFAGRLANTDSSNTDSSNTDSRSTDSSDTVLLLRPLLYMNRSGGPTLEVATRFTIPPSRILAVFDDLDLPLGRLRVRRRGGSGGHNGVQDLIDRLAEWEPEPAETPPRASGGAEESGEPSGPDRQPEPFPRIRLGIGKPTEGDIESHVLGRFTAKEQPIADAMVELAAEAVVSWLGEGIGPAMNSFNRDASVPPAPEPGE